MFNIISRILGSIIRTFTILCGLIVTIMSLILSPFIVIFYLLTPFLLFPYYLFFVNAKKKDAEKIISSTKDIKNIILKSLKTDEGKFIFVRLGLPPDSVSKSLSSIYIKGDYALFEKELVSIKKSGQDLTITDLLRTIYASYQPFQKLLEYHNIKYEDIKEASIWYNNQNQKFPTTHLSDLNSLLSIPFIGRNWSYGYTPRINAISQDLSASPMLYPRLVGRDQEINRLEQILSQSQQNSAIVVGEPGVGRHAIVTFFAKRISHGWGLPPLANKHVKELDMPSLFGQFKDKLTIKKHFSEILKEASFAGNIILVIDNFDIYISDGNGRINLADVFSENLRDGRLQIIAITDPNSYHIYIEPNSELTQIFDKLEIVPPPHDVVLSELEISIVPVLELKHDITITLGALREIIKNAERFISQNPFPEKAIDLLDEVIIFVMAEKKEKMVTSHHVLEYLTRKTKIPIGSIDRNEQIKLKNLESLMHKYIVNQEEAINHIAQALRRRRTHVADENKPIGTFLFLGPTGVGKTETAKTLARIYYGSEDHMQRFDMSQYQNDEGIARLIGSEKYGPAGELTQKIIDNPFSLILFDELEKGDSKVQNLLLTLLDEGYINDGMGRKIDARNNIIIATSNAAAEHIRELVLKGTKNEVLQKEIVDYVQKKHIFSPEFLNRFDAVIVFTPLSEGQLRQVTRLMLEKLNKQIAPQGISIDINDHLVKSLTSYGFDPVFGARAIKRAIAEKVEDKIADQLLSGAAAEGKIIKINI